MTVLSVLLPLFCRRKKERPKEGAKNSFAAAMFRKSRNVLYFIISQVLKSSSTHSYCLLLLEMTMKNPQELPLCLVLIEPDTDDEPPRKRLKSESSASQNALLHAARLALSHTRDVNSRPSPLRVDNEFSKKNTEAWLQRVPKCQSTREQPPKQSNLIQTCRSGNTLRKASLVSALLSVRSDPKALPLGRPLQAPPFLPRFVYRLAKDQEIHLIR
jgi:hypothetical protein